MKSPPAHRNRGVSFAQKGRLLPPFFIVSLIYCIQCVEVSPLCHELIKAATLFDAARNSNIYAANEQFRKIYFQGGKGTDTAHLNARGHDRFLPVAERFIMQYLEE